LTNYLLIIGSGLEITEKCALPKARAANVTQQVLFTFFLRNYIVSMILTNTCDI
jgi:hypothetical protein